MILFNLGYVASNAQATREGELKLGVSDSRMG